MVLESRVKSINLKLGAIVVTIWRAEERVEVAKAKAQAAEAKVALVGTWAIDEYKKSEDFKGEVGEAAYDAFLKGFTKCKGKVIKAFSDLDLGNIIAKEPK